MHVSVTFSPGRHPGIGLDSRLGTMPSLMGDGLSERSAGSRRSASPMRPVARHLSGRIRRQDGLTRENSNYRRYRHTGPPQLGLVSVDVGTLLSIEHRDDAAVRDLGHLLLGVLFTMPEWVIRRVESVRPADNRRFRRQMSVDFRFPRASLDAARTAFSSVPLPLSYLAKGDLSAFDLWDESNCRLPLLTSRENTVVMGAVVRAAFDRLGASLDDESVGHLHDVIRSAPGDAAGVLDGLIDQVPNVGPALEPLRSWLRSVLGLLPGHFVMLADIGGLDQLERRRIVKFAYDQPTRINPGGRHVATELALHPLGVRIPLPAVLLASSYHFEFLVPDGLAISAAWLYADPGRTQLLARSVTAAGQDPSPLVHLSCREAVPYDAVAEAFVHVRPVAGGPLRAARWLTTSAALLFATLYFAAGRLMAASGVGGPRSGGTTSGNTSVGTNLGIPVTLLLVVPGLAAALLGRPGEHVMASSRLRGVRLLSILTSVLLFVSAGFLVLGNADTLRAASLVFALIAGCAALLLWCAERLSRGRRHAVWPLSWATGLVQLLPQAPLAIVFAAAWLVVVIGAVLLAAVLAVKRAALRIHRAVHAVVVGLVVAAVVVLTVVFPVAAIVAVLGALVAGAAPNFRTAWGQGRIREARRRVSNGWRRARRFVGTPHHWLNSCTITS